MRACLALIVALFAGCGSVNYWTQDPRIPEGWRPLHSLIVEVDDPDVMCGTPADGCTARHMDAAGKGYVIVYVKKGLSLERLRCVRAHEFEHEMGRIHNLPDPMGGWNCGDGT